MVTCSHCSKASGIVTSIGLVDGLSYYTDYECRSCHKIFKIICPLVEEETGEYKVIFTKLTGNIQLHHLVWQWTHPGIEIKGVIHHLNGHKRDNRPCNLYMMEHGHSPYLDSDNPQRIIVQLKKRIRYLEGLLKQLKM